MEILENIPVEINITEIKRRLHITRDVDLNLAQQLIEESSSLIEAKALYKICYIEEKLENAVRVDGLSFKSKVLRKNLDGVERIFPYVVTIGAKFEEEMRNNPDLLKKFYLDTIGTLALTSARKYLEAHLRSKYALGKVSFMSPGSLSDWPIEEQRPLFELLEDVDNAIGVKLNNSLLMIPAKSVSGIYFPTEITFFSCQLCPRKECMGRKAAYSESLAKEYGVLE
ncbi:MAG: hypothetical protein JSV83_13615 [Desulfobacterales bacterium]|nr:MAG: hypothetical protein JSV83_13615 [Desulfobacterales bacterium]